MFPLFRHSHSNVLLSHDCWASVRKLRKGMAWREMHRFNHRIPCENVVLQLTKAGARFCVLLFMSILMEHQFCVLLFVTLYTRLLFAMPVFSIRMWCPFGCLSFSSRNMFHSKLWFEWWFRSPFIHYLCCFWNDSIRCQSVNQSHAFHFVRRINIPIGIVF